MDLVKTLRSLAAHNGKPETLYSIGDDAADEIERLRDMIIRREEFIAKNNLWADFSAWLAEPDSLNAE